MPSNRNFTKNEKRGEGGQKSNQITRSSCLKKTDGQSHANGDDLGEGQERTTGGKQREGVVGGSHGSIWTGIGQMMQKVGGFVALRSADRVGVL